jgi:hypothetical protein
MLFSILTDQYYSTDDPDERRRIHEQANCYRSGECTASSGGGSGSGGGYSGPTLAERIAERLHFYNQAVGQPPGMSYSAYVSLVVNEISIAGANFNFGYDQKEKGKVQIAGRKGLDISQAYFTYKYGWELGNVVDSWWDDEITDEDLYNKVGIDFVDWDDVEYTYDGKTDQKDQNWSSDEWYAAFTLSAMGYDVIANRRTGEKTFDWWVDGKKVELKTPKPGDGNFNLNTTLANISKGINQQGAEVVIVDLRLHVDDDSYDALDILNLYYYSTLKLKTDNTPYTLRIFTDDGFFNSEIKKVNGTAI